MDLLIVRCNAFRVTMFNVCAVCSLFAATYSWQQPHAGIAANGDLYWQPEPFVLSTNDAVLRYIDFESGDDGNDGASPATAWQHHPWDADATAQSAAAAAGIYTYVFKRGVVYRNMLTGKAVGAPNNPIRLTSDPNWGVGEAAFHASVLLTNGWTYGAHTLMPSTVGVYYTDLTFAPRRVWFIDGTNIVRLALARTPNWTESYIHDVKSEWWTWQSTRSTNIGGTAYYVCRDSVHLTQPIEYYTGSYVWTEYFPVMGTPYPQTIVGFDASRRELFFQSIWGDMQLPAQHNRYFLEDNPRYLDSPGEFWFDKSGAGGRLYIRLPGNQNPNGLRIEAARNMGIIDNNGMGHVEISGLTFRFNNAYWNLAARYFADKNVVNAAIRVLGYGTNIVIKNCVFEHVPNAIRIETANTYMRLDGVTISDNIIRETDHAAIYVKDYGKASMTLRNLNLLRNNLYRIGLRPYQADGHGHAVVVEFPASAEIAGNVLYRCFGSGLFIYGGKASGTGWIVPFTRILIHHNRVEDSLLSCNDWGGIETWQGGPFYVYSNISGNPGGYWNPSHVWNITKPASQRTYSTARLGFAFYLDGSYKNYVFNNVVWGLNNNLTSALCNASAFQAAGSFQNVYANNTIYKFGCAFRRDGDRSGRNQYLGNLQMDLSDWVYHTATIGTITNDYDYRNLAFTHNVFQGLPRNFGRFERTLVNYTTFAAFQTALSNRLVLSSQLGKIESAPPVRDAASHDFQLEAGSTAIDYGAKTFAPWALSRVVGEWHFRRNNENPAFLQDDHWYMTAKYLEREMYYQTPRQHLTAVNVSASDYGVGPLESWCDSALHFNGVDRYAWTRGVIDNVVGLDMLTNDLIIEAYLRTAPDHTGGVICAKASNSGYVLSIDEFGRPLFTVRLNGSVVYKRAGSVHINDGNWHHLLVQAERRMGPGASMYTDGFRTELPAVGSIPGYATMITNSGNFEVGRGPDGNYFAGDIDFLRLARSTIADAMTSIEELYEWQFNGPFLRDFRGVMAYGQRDAGAFEYVPNFTLPRIVRHPQHQTVELNGAVGFRVMADNADAYQWRLDGTPLSAATNFSLRIASSGPADAGAYDVIVENSAGSVTSAVAILQVVPEPFYVPALLIAVFYTVRRLLPC